MRKSFSILMLLAAAATASVSCQKQDAAPVPEETMLVFTSEKPAFDDAVKTEWVEAENSVHWSHGDKIGMAYTITVEGTPVWQGAAGANSIGEDPKIYKSTGVDLDGGTSKTASFTVAGYFGENPSETILEEGKYNFYTLYPADCTSSTDFASGSAGVVNVSIPVTQTPGADTFDSSADIMVGKSVAEYDRMPAEAVSVKWNRVVAHAYITLMDINESVSGEVINTITLTAQDGAHLTGAYTVNLADGTFAYRTSGGGPKNTVTITATDLPAITASQDVSFWACMMPCTWTSLTVDVDTDKATYTREIDLTSKNKTFVQNRRNLLTINMSEAVRTPKSVPEPEPETEKYYVKVTSAPADWSGTYLIVNEADSKAYDGSKDTDNLDKTGNYVDVEILDFKIVSSISLDNSSFVISKDGDKYKVCSSSGYYIGNKTTGFNKAKTYKSDTHANTISYDAVNNCVIISGIGGYKILWSGSKFSYYNTANKPIQLYKLEE